MKNPRRPPQSNPYMSSCNPRMSASGIFPAVGLVKVKAWRRQIKVSSSVEKDRGVNLAFNREEGLRRV